MQCTTLACFQYSCLWSSLRLLVLLFRRGGEAVCILWHHQNGVHSKTWRTPTTQVNISTLKPCSCQFRLIEANFSIPGQVADPKELKRQKDRERYARNRDEILRKKRHARLLNKQTTSIVNGEHITSRTHVTTSHGRCTLYTSLLKTITEQLSLIARIIYDRTSGPK